jgi:enamine deaminase RidA (YjgF/YER057c/UK114 family)
VIERFGSGGPYEEMYGYSRVVRAGDRLVTAGCTATVGGVVTGVGDPYAQTLTAFRVALDALARAGAGIEDVVRTVCTSRTAPTPTPPGAPMASFSHRYARPRRC